MVSWIIRGELAVSSRPGYAPGEERAVPLAAVEAWIEEDAQGGRAVGHLPAGRRSAAALRGGALPEGLLGRYRASGFEVAHLGVRDGLTEPYTAAQLDEAWASFRRLPKPVLVHCSAGYDRTGRVVRHILGRLEEAGR